MPHLRIRGMKEDEIVKISTELLDELVRVIDVPRNHITIEHIKSTFIFDGETDKNKAPFVDVLWFDRENKMQEVAHVITTFIKPFEYKDVTVYFTNLTKEQYFENGEHF